MFSRILTFSVLSVFCVLMAISSVYAHDVSGVQYNDDVYHRHDDDGDGNFESWHYHRNVNHRATGRLTDSCPTRRASACGTPVEVGHPTVHDHWKPGWDHSTAAEEPADPPEQPVNTQPVVSEVGPYHAHAYLAHKHGDFGGHEHPPYGHKHEGGDSAHDHHTYNHDDENQRPVRHKHEGGDSVHDHHPVNTQQEQRQIVEQESGHSLDLPERREPPLGARFARSDTIGVPPPENQPTVNQAVGSVATGSAPQEPRQERPPEPPPLQPLRVTEYMVRDWSTGVGGNLPQWIELYNPNTEAVNLKGWTFQYATRQFANSPYKIHTLTLAATEDGFRIPGGGVAILSTQQLREGQFSGIEATQVYALGIENVLKRGWVLTDADGEEVHRLGRGAFEALRDPAAPAHQDGARVSYHVYKSESPSEPYYYGYSGDIGSPGFYEQPAPSAPSAVRRKRVGTWASLKK